MGRFGDLIVFLYLTVAAAYGGWRGPDLWSGWGIWCFFLPPVVWAFLIAVRDWWRNPGWTSVKIAVVMGGCAALALGGVALGAAWVMAEATEKLSKRFTMGPEIRAILGTGIWGLFGGLVFLLRNFGTRSVPQRDILAEGGTAPDRDSR